MSSSRIFTACLPQQVDLQLLMTDTVTMAHYDYLNNWPEELNVTILHPPLN